MLFHRNPEAEGCFPAAAAAAAVRAPCLRAAEASTQLYNQRTQTDKLLGDINNPGMRGRMCLMARWAASTCMCEHTNGGFF